MDHPTMPYGHDPEAILQAIDKDTKVIFIANPNNPTGTWWTASQWQAFIAEVPPQVLVVYDEAYQEYADVPDYPQVEAQLTAYPNVIISRSFSKAYGLAALRLGYFLAHPSIINVLNRLRNPFNVNALAQVAGIAALADQAFVAESAAKVRAEREKLRDFFQKQGFMVLPSQGNFITVRFGANSQRLNQALLQHGIIVRPLANYGLGDFLRLSIGLPSENQRLCHTFLKIWPTLS
jgi:histidinol-phosphate aminotransferase